MAEERNNRKELFESMPVPKALATMAVPTIISQMISVIYNMVDAFYIGRTGNSYMMAATTLTMTLMFLSISFSNLFGIGGGSLIARLMGMHREEEAKAVSAFSVYGAAAISVVYSILAGLFLEPILNFLGASSETLGFAKQYATYVVIIGCLFQTLSMTLAFLLRNAGYSGKASVGLSGGGILNMILDPIFMFVILPKGMEVTGAAVATLLSNVCSCIYLLVTIAKVSKTSPLSLKPSDAKKISRRNLKNVFAVGVPSAIMTSLFDLATVCANKLASSHSDFVLAGLGIVMKIERIPNAVNIGLSQGMLPIVAYNYASGNHERMRKTIRVTRITGLVTACTCLALLQIFARPIASFFMSTTAGDAASAAVTIAIATTFLRIRCLASPVQFLNYSSTYTMQGLGKGGGTLIQAIVRELVFYIPLMFLLDKLFGEKGLAAALPLGEALGAAVALVMVHFILKKATNKRESAEAEN